MGDSIGTKFYKKMNKMNKSDLNKKLDEYLSNREQLNKNSLRVMESELQSILGMDELNAKYFLTLYEKYKEVGDKSSRLVIADANVDGDKGFRKNGDNDVIIAYPTATAPKEIQSVLPLQQYCELLKKTDPQIAREGVLWIKKMQAGTGSSIKRDLYLSIKKNLLKNEVVLGAKGTDLFIPSYGDEMISLAEAQILQSLYDIKAQKYHEIILHDIFSNETEKSIAEIWNKKSIIDNRLTYKEVVAKTKGLKRGGHSYQHHIPTIDEDFQISFNRVAPGGHALFGVEALLMATRSLLLPKVEKGKILISSIGNGEDLSSSPDEYMVSWMIENKIPIAMVTTTKTEIDLKGGQIAIVPARDEQDAYVTIIERAQAEDSGQSDLFEKLGLRAGDGEAFFNTNMILLNYNVLSPKLESLVDEIGEVEFLKIISPDLIKNVKKQKEIDGSVRQYIQLEGAMGSVVLNLDHYWRSRYKSPLVHILNVGVSERTKFFSPIKTAFDFFMQFYSDRFDYDNKKCRLINKNISALPNISLSGTIYSEVQSVLDNFKDCEIVDLKKLQVIGDISFSDLVLRGEVIVESQRNELVNLALNLSLGLRCKCFLPKENNKFVLNNIRVFINHDGEISLLSID